MKALLSSTVTTLAPGASAGVTMAMRRMEMSNRVWKAR